MANYARVLKFNPNHKPAGQPDGGQFASGSGGIATTPSKISELFTRIAQPDGGFTYNAHGDFDAVGGYALSIYPERSFAKAAKDLTKEDLADFVYANSDLLSKADNYFGAWHDPDSGQVFLDVSMVTQDKTKAHALALQHDQIAYFDLSTFQSVTVNKDATSGGAKKRER